MSTRLWIYRYVKRPVPYSHLILIYTITFTYMYMYTYVKVCTSIVIQRWFRRKTFSWPKNVSWNLRRDGRNGSSAESTVTSTHCSIKNDDHKKYSVSRCYIYMKRMSRNINGYNFSGQIIVERNYSGKLLKFKNRM